MFKFLQKLADKLVNDFVANADGQIVQEQTNKLNLRLEAGKQELDEFSQAAKGDLKWSDQQLNAANEILFKTPIVPAGLNEADISGLPPITLISALSLQKAHSGDDSLHQTEFSDHVEIMAASMSGISEKMEAANLDSKSIAAYATAMPDDALFYMMHENGIYQHKSIPELYEESGLNAG